MRARISLLKITGVFHFGLNIPLTRALSIGNSFCNEASRAFNPSGKIFATSSRMIWHWLPAKPRRRSSKSKPRISWSEPLSGELFFIQDAGDGRGDGADAGECFVGDFAFGNPFAVFRFDVQQQLHERHGIETCGDEIGLAVEFGFGCKNVASQKSEQFRFDFW